MAVAQKIPENCYVWKYGYKWPPLRIGRHLVPTPGWQIELNILQKWEKARLFVPEIGEWTDHFKAFVAAIWDRPDTQYRFTWNPYATRMLEEAHTRKLLGISGHASSGKSQFGAIWAITNFLIDPLHTKVLVTSTSLQESRMRIWGVIEKYWEEARAFLETQCTPMPGKLVSSSGKITGWRNGKADDLVGLTLVAGGNGNDKDASTKIGFKAGKLILVADELPLLTHKLYDAVTNLLSNDNFQMIGTGNLTSILDPFGLFVEPLDGWSSVTETTYGWDTKCGGYCLRFDGEESPNVRAGARIYPGLLTVEGLQEIRARFGERSPGYYRMVKSFPCPTGDTESVYTEVELSKNNALKGNTLWLEKPTPLAFLDPSFSKGGDRAAAAFGLIGTASHPITGERIKVLEKTETVDLMRKVNARHPDKDRNEQLAELYHEECVKRSISVTDRGVDSTGSGDAFASILGMKMGAGVCKVSFAGAASDKRVSALNKKTGKDRFCNRVTELWFIGKDFISAGQLRGVDPTTAMEMCARTYKEVKERALVEPKDDMKKRTNGRSPDFADALMGLIEVARDRHGFTPAAKVAESPAEKNARKSPMEKAIDEMFGRGESRKITYRDTLEIPAFSGGGGWGE